MRPEDPIAARSLNVFHERWGEARNAPYSPSVCESPVMRGCRPYSVRPRRRVGLVALVRRNGNKSSWFALSENEGGNISAFRGMSFAIILDGDNE